MERYRKITLFAVALALIFIDSVRPLPHFQRAPAAKIQTTTLCPNSFADWAAWRSKILKNPNQPIDLITGDALLLQTCKTKMNQQIFFSEPTFAACMQNLDSAQILLEAVRRNALQEDAEESFGTIFKQAEAPIGLDGKSLLDLPDVFKAPGKINQMWVTLSELSLIDLKQQPHLYQADALADSIASLPAGWEAFTYESNIIHSRAVIFLKQDPERIQLLHMDSFSMNAALGINIITKGKTQSDSPEIYFSSYHLDEKTKMLRTSAEENRCVICHRAGIMPVPSSEDPMRPVHAYSKNHSDGEIVSWFNNTIAPQYANANLAGGNSLDIPLPEIGEIDPPQRTDEFIQKCSEHTHPPQRRSAIRKAMNCANCHDGDAEYGVGKVSFQNLNFPTESIKNYTHGGDAYYSIGTLIERGIMPPNNDLSADERTDLFKCLRDEYYGGFQASGVKTVGTFLRSMGEKGCLDSGSKK